MPSVTTIYPSVRGGEAESLAPTSLQLAQQAAKDAEEARDEAVAIANDALGAVPEVFVPDIPALKALDTSTKRQAYLTEAGSEAQYVFRLGDYSLVVDDYNYVEADGAPSTYGAWVRVIGDYDELNNLPSLGTIASHDADEIYDPPESEADYDDSSLLGLDDSNPSAPAIVKLPLNKILATKSLAQLGATSSMSASAVGDLNSAISTAFASGVRRIDGLDKTYAVTGSAGLLMPQGVELFGYQLDISGADNGCIGLSVIGSQGSGVSLTGDALFGTNIVPVADNSQFARGDFVYISDDTVFFTTTKQGEANRVIGLSGSTGIVLECALSMSFTTAANATIAKMASPANRLTHLRDFEIVGGADNAKTGQYGILAQYCDGLLIENPETRKIPNRHIYLYRSIDVQIDRPTMRRATDPGLAYGIVTGFGSRGVRVFGGSGSDMRHFHATGSGSAGGVNIDIIVDGADIRGMTSAALDCHAPTINATYQNCRINLSGSYGSESKEGITMQGLNMRANRNTIRGGGGVAIVLQPLVTGGPYFAGGVFEANDNTIEDNAGIAINVDVTSAGADKVRCNGNRAINVDKANSNASIHIRATNGKRINSVEALDNDANNVSRGVYIRATGAGSSIGHVDEQGNTTRNATYDGSYIVADTSGVIETVITGGGKVDTSNATAGNAGRFLSAASGGKINELIVRPGHYKSCLKGFYALANGSGSEIASIMLRGGFSRNITNENFYVNTASGGVVGSVTFGDCDTDGGTTGLRSNGVTNVFNLGTSKHANNTPWNFAGATVMRILPDLTTATQAVVTNATYTVANGVESIICDRAATITITLPSAALYPGRCIRVKTIQAQQVDSNASNVVPIDGGSAGTAILPNTDGAWADLESNGTDWLIMAKGP